MFALIVAAQLLHPAVQVGAPVTLPANAKILVTWSNSPTGPGSTILGDSQDGGEYMAIVNGVGTLLNAPSYTCNLGSGYVSLYSGPSLVLSQGGAFKTIATPQGPIEVNIAAAFQITNGGQFPGPADGWDVTITSASPFSATFTANTPYVGNGWGGPVTFTFTQVP